MTVTKHTVIVGFIIDDLEVLGSIFPKFKKAQQDAEDNYQKSYPDDEEDKEEFIHDYLYDQLNNIVGKGETITYGSLRYFTEIVPHDLVDLGKFKSKYPVYMGLKIGTCTRDIKPIDINKVITAKNLIENDALNAPDIAAFNCLISQGIKIHHVPNDCDCCS